MKAIRMTQVGGPEVLDYVDVPTPVPRPSEVLVKADTIGVGKYDVLVRTGTYPFPVPIPVIPGIEITGVVEAVGKDVTSIAVGQKVQVWKFERGCYAEYVACEPHEITILPDGVDMEAAIALPAYQVAWGMLHDAADSRRRRIACINGAAGNIGTAMIHLCRAANIPIIGVTRSAEKCAFALSQGANHVVDSSTENLAARIDEITQGRGLDLLFDHIVGPDFRDNLKLMAPLGQIVTFNALGGLPSSDLFADLRQNLDRSISIRAYSVHVYDPFPEVRIRIAGEVCTLFEQGKIKPAITGRFALRDAARAHAMLDAGEVLGKIVLKP